MGPALSQHLHLAVIYSHIYLQTQKQIAGRVHPSRVLWPHMLLPGIIWQIKYH